MTSRRISLPVINYSPNRLSPCNYNYNYSYLNDISEFNMDPPFMPTSPSTSTDASPKMLRPVRPASARPYRRRRKPCEPWPSIKQLDFNEDHFDDFFDSSTSPSPRPFYNHNNNEQRGASPSEFYTGRINYKPTSSVNSSCSTYPSSNETQNDENVEMIEAYGGLKKFQKSMTVKNGRVKRIQQMRSFNVDGTGKVVDCGFRQSRPSKPIARNPKNRRATCPEIWLSAADDDFPDATKCVLRVYGSSNVGKKTIAKQMAMHADITACSDLNGLDNEEDGPINAMSFMLNDQEIQLQIIQGSALELDAFDDNTIPIYMVVYSIDNRESFLRAAQVLYRLQDAKKRGERLGVILVGNKIDLQRIRKVSFIEGKMLSKIYKGSFVEVSSLLTMNMDQVWESTVRKLQKFKTIQEREQNSGKWEQRTESPRKFMGRIFKQGRRFAKSCEEIVARLALR